MLHRVGVSPPVPLPSRGLFQGAGPAPAWRDRDGLGCQEPFHPCNGILLSLLP